ncbi:GntR family transcriptional regulator [Microbacterium saperdae]|uniref:DNA-binding GntR family transcriptional regulator n=1 Tax=Microbacterium saperdae TaxID=69368 RepID=A0A543BBG5_9MICO|nr:GntR family transcriptional regulator [Microbacterium saperdae]TQL82194.1 DNA-binding GntR family transcriptional regulator [Microbacterium saperdae]GGM37910.1 hypothetical protein GCM10010489_06120 [Microbacterium saperdae]
MTDAAQIDSLQSTRLLSGGEASAPLVSSRADAVVDTLAAAIEAGDLRPGDPLSVSALTERLGVSAATVRAGLGVLDGMHLIEHRMNRASVVITPTPAWFIAVASECSGLSVSAADLGIAHATDAQLAEFVERSAYVRALWETDEHDQIVGAEGLWELIDLLATFSRNHYLRELHAAKRTALVFGIHALSKPRNPAMLRSVVDALVLAVRSRDRIEATDIVRDLYMFVIDGVVEL